MSPTEKIETAQFYLAISWREQVTFRQDDDDDDVRIILYQEAFLNLYSIMSLKQQSVSRHMTPLGHIILIPSLSVIALTHGLPQSGRPCYF